MVKIFLVLLVGFLLGFFGLIKGRAVRLNSKLQTVWLLLLIFCMGVSIGRNGDVIRNLPSLGGQAFLFALFTATGSILLVFLFSKLFLQKKEEE